MTDADLDRPIWGARAIGSVAGCLNEDGTVDERGAFYLIENGLLGDAVAKVGRRYVTTPRKILQALAVIR
jgi:hypothetical protein